MRIPTKLVTAPIASTLRRALGYGSLVLLTACGGGSGGESAAPVALGAALPDEGDFIALEQQSLSLSEASRVGSVQVSRLGSAQGASSVAYRFIAGSADASTDFRGVDGVLNWSDGERASKTISFIVASDLENENAEDFRIELSDVTGQESLGINNSVSVTLIDSVCSESVPELVIADTELSAPCYRLTKNTLVDASAQLKVSAGTTIIAEASTSILLSTQASLNLEGTSQLPVFVKSASGEAGGWNGFALLSNSALHRVQYAEVSGAINAFNLSSGGFAAFDNNLLSDNEGAGVVLPLDSVETVGLNNQFVATPRGIELVGSTIEENQTVELPAQSTHYVLSGGLINNGTLQIAAGTDLRMAADVHVLVLPTGAINAIGTAEQPISIQGLQESPGYWNGIQYVSSTSESNRFEHVQIAHGGGDPARSGNIIVDGLNTRITMQQCALTHSAGYGVVYESGAFQVDLIDVTYDQNVLGDQSL